MCRYIKISQETTIRWIGWLRGSCKRRCLTVNIPSAAVYTNEVYIYIYLIYMLYIYIYLNGLCSGKPITGLGSIYRTLVLHWTPCVIHVCFEFSFTNDWFRMKRNMPLNTKLPLVYNASHITQTSIDIRWWKRWRSGKERRELYCKGGESKSWQGVHAAPLTELLNWSNKLHQTHLA